MLILARTHLLDGCETTGRRIKEEQRRVEQSELHENPLRAVGNLKQMRGDSPELRRDPRRSCRPARCRGRSRCWPRSSSWRTGTGRPSETPATPAATRITYRQIQRLRTADPSHRPSERRLSYLVSLINDGSVVRQRLHNVEVFNSCCK